MGAFFVSLHEPKTSRHEKIRLYPAVGSAAHGMRRIPPDERRTPAGETIRRDSLDGRLPLGFGGPQPHADARLASTGRHLCRNLSRVPVEHLSEPLRHGHGTPPGSPRRGEQQFLRPYGRPEAFGIRLAGRTHTGILGRRTDLEHGRAAKSPSAAGRRLCGHATRRNPPTTSAQTG